MARRKSRQLKSGQRDKMTNTMKRYVSGMAWKRREDDSRNAKGWGG